jgi:quercetin dioxygenase-like cupin family protein
MLKSALLLLAQSALGQAVIGHDSDLKWSASGSLPPGAEYHLLHEDAKTHAVQSFAKFPGKYFLPQHAHTHNETIVVIKGKLEITVDGKTETLAPGSYVTIPAATPHTLKAGWRGCEILVVLDGPFDLKQ